ncbi:MAG: N-acetylmuramoyl-L-alanine amidase, partial [Pseudomonadota bacterium]
IVNPGHEWGYTVFPMAQIEAVISLLQDIQQRRHIKPTMVLGHSDVAPNRKEDPGEKFPWDRLATERLAIGTFQGGFDASGEDALSYSEAILSLRDIGYDVPDNHHAAAVLAFQRRFCPAALGQGINPLTKAAIEWAKRKFTG